MSVLRRASVCAALALAVGLLGSCRKERLLRTESTLEVSVEGLDFGRVALGVGAEHGLRVRNSGRAPLHLSGAQVEAPFSVEGFPPGGVTLGGGESRSLRVAFSPQAEGRFEGRLALAADADQGGQTPVTLVGEAVRVLVGIAPAALDFGQVLVGTERTLTLELANPNDLRTEAHVRWDGAAGFFSTPAFSGATAALSLAPGQRRALPFTFRPERMGLSTATLWIVPCAGCAEVAVPLRGEGVTSCIGASPTTLEFGPVEVGQEAVLPVDIRNLGAFPVELAEAYLASSSASSFQLTNYAPGARVPLPAGATAPLFVRFAPTGGGLQTGVLRVRAGSGTNACWAEAKLRAVGGSSCLSVDPGRLRFGTVAVGMRGERTVTVTNLACPGDVWLESVGREGAPAFRVMETPALPARLAPGASATVTVGFEPAEEGPFYGSLTLTASDAVRAPLTHPPAPVSMEGLGKVFPPCRLSVTPAGLDFGDVQLKTSANLVFRLANESTEACYLQSVRLAPGAPSAFRAYGTTQGTVLEPGRTHGVRVRFHPTAVGPEATALEVVVSDPANPARSYPIQGRGIDACLSVRPVDLEFGSTLLSCPPAVMVSRLVNACGTDVEVTALTPGATTGGEFSLASPPALPQVLKPGDNLEVRVRFAPAARGPASAAFYAQSSVGRQLIGARGSGTLDPVHVDYYEQPLAGKVDVLFVLDNSGSMADKQAAVGANLAAFLKNAIAQNVDYHLAVTTSGLGPSVGGWITCPGGADGGENGRFFPVDGATPRVITPQTPDPEAVWAHNTAVGVCHWLEQGLEAGYRALTSPLIDLPDDPRTPAPNDGNGGFLRPDAKLAVVFVSDEDDQSPGTVQFYLEAYRALKPDPTQLTLAAMVSPLDISNCPGATSPGTRFHDLMARAGGFVEPICADWASSLERVGFTAFGLQAVFPLTAPLADPSAITVRVNGAPVGGWRYDGPANAVRFDVGSVPGAGSSIEIEYPMACRP